MSARAGGDVHRLAIGQALVAAHRDWYFER
jgi:hypothetical protein